MLHKEKCLIMPFACFPGPFLATGPVPPNGGSSFCCLCTGILRFEGFAEQRLFFVDKRKPLRTWKPPWYTLKGVTRGAFDEG